MSDRTPMPWQVALLTKFGLPTVLLLAGGAFAGKYLLNEQKNAHEEAMAIADSIEDVRDALEALLKDSDLAIPTRRRLSKDKR